VTDVLLGDNALLPVAAAAAKGEVVAFANELKDGIDLVSELLTANGEGVGLKPPNPDELPKPPNVGC
jgi:hypothetical protein